MRSSAAATARAARQRVQLKDRVPTPNCGARDIGALRYSTFNR